MVNSSVKNWRGCHGSHFARLPGNVCRPGAGRVRVNTLILMRLPEIPYCSTPHVIDTDVVQTGIAVPLSNHDEPDSYCIDAHVLQVNRLRHVFEQADSSSRTERSGDPGSRGFNDLLDTG